MRLVIGDVLHSLADLGSGGAAAGRQRLPRRRAERWTGCRPGRRGTRCPRRRTTSSRSMVRKVGGFTFQELNLTIDDIRATGEAGADLSYDFVTRPAYHHALATGDTEFLRLTPAHLPGRRRRPRLAGARAAEPRRADLRAACTGRTGHTRRPVPLPTAREITGGDLGDTVRHDLCRPPHRRRRPLQPGVHHERHRLHHRHASSPPSLGITDLDAIDDDDIDRIRRAHLLLAMYNALQPGVFALSGLGPVRHAHAAARPRCPSCSSSGDTRWINRGAHDLMGVEPAARRSRRPGCRGAGACTGRCPSSSTTRPASPASSRRSWPSASATASRSAARSTSRTSRTAACS